MDIIVCSLVNLRYDEQEQEMSHNTLNQFNALATQLAADGTIAEERAHEILETELAREVLEAIVAGQIRLRGCCIDDYNAYKGLSDPFKGDYGVLV